MSKYDTNKDGVLSQEELEQIKAAYKIGENIEILKAYDKNNDGQLDDEELQKLVEDVKTTDTAFRYTGYTAVASSRIAAALRYTAYTSDVGESFRPIIPPKLVTFTYALSWAYVIVDVAIEGIKSYRRKLPRNEILGVVTERSIFQSLASMIFPAMIIHTQVKIFQKILKRVGLFQKWGPTVAGLAIVPFLPYVLDHPVESALHWCKVKIFGDSHEKSKHE